MIACPSCHSPIEVTEILWAQIIAEVRSETEASARRQQAELTEPAASSMPIRLLGRQRVTSVVEALISMQVDLDFEKRSTKRLWSKRERKILQAVGNLASFYGDFQGFIGTSLPTIEGLDVPKIECDSELLLK